MVVRTVKDKNRGLWESLRGRGSEAFSEDVLEPEPRRFLYYTGEVPKGKQPRERGMPWRGYET